MSRESGHDAKEFGRDARKTGESAGMPGREANAIDDGAKEVDLDARELGHGTREFGDDTTDVDGDAGNRCDAWRELDLLRLRFIMAIKVRRDIHWAKPEDIFLDPDAPLPEFRGFDRDGFNIVRADGSVSFFHETMPDEAPRKFLTPSGGEIIDLDEHVLFFQDSQT